jgi:hypothetical protein
MESEIYKLRNSNPLVNLMQTAIWEVLSDDRYNGTTVAEAVGVLEFVKHDLLDGNWGD